MKLTQSGLIMAGLKELAPQLALSFGKSAKDFVFNSIEELVDWIQEQVVKDANTFSILSSLPAFQSLWAVIGQFKEIKELFGPEASNLMGVLAKRRIREAAQHGDGKDVDGSDYQLHRELLKYTHERMHVLQRSLGLSSLKEVLEVVTLLRTLDTNEMEAVLELWT